MIELGEAQIPSAREVAKRVEQLSDSVQRPVHGRRRRNSAHQSASPLGQRCTIAYRRSLATRSRRHRSSQCGSGHLLRALPKQRRPVAQQLPTVPVEDSGQGGGRGLTWSARRKGSGLEHRYSARRSFGQVRPWPRCRSGSVVPPNATGPVRSRAAHSGRPAELKPE